MDIMSGDHAGRVYKITRVTPTSVQIRQDGSRTGMNAKRIEGVHTIPMARWEACYVPATARDQRICSTRPSIVQPLPPIRSAADWVPEIAPEAQAQVYEFAKEEPIVTASDIDSSGAEVRVSLPTKRCAACGKDKLRGNFHRWARAKDGLKPVCKECAAARALIYNQSKRQQKSGDGPVLTTTDNNIIEHRLAGDRLLNEISPAEFREAVRGGPDNNIIEPAPVRGKRWLVKAWVYEEREYFVTAASFTEAAEQAVLQGTNAQQFEIVSVSLES
jgi:hypothetical protein